MFTRMSDVRSGKAIDSEGEAINNVEISLKRVGIELRDSRNSFRDIQDVITEIGSRWKEFSEIDQNFIARQIAGTRQKEQFLVLMENQLEIQKALTAATDSTGLATERYGIYLKSVEAAQNEWTASWERLATSGVTKGMIVDVYTLGAGILDLISNLGGLPTVLSLVAIGFVAVQGAEIAATIASWSLTAAWAALAAVNPLTWIAVAVGGAVIAFNYFYESAEETQIKIQELNKTIADTQATISKLSKEKTTIRELWAEFETLKSKTQLSNTEQERMYEIQQKLKDISPALLGSYDQEGRFILDQTVNLKTLIDLKNEELRIIKEKLALTSQEGLKSQTDTYKTLQEQIKEITDRLNDPFIAKDIKNNLEKELKNKLLLSDEALNSIKTSFYSAGGEAQMSYIAGLIAKGDEASLNLADILQKMLNDAHPLDGIVIPVTVAISPKSYESLSADLKSIQDSISMTSDILGKSLAGTLDFSDVEKLIAYNAEYAKYAEIIDGKITISTANLQKLDLQKAQDILYTAMQNGASKEQIAILQAYVDSLKDGSAYAKIYQKAQEDAQKAAEEAAQKAKDAIQEQIDAAKKLLDLTISMIRQEKEAKKNKLQDELDEFKKNKSKEIDIIHKEKDTEKTHLKEQLDSYKKLIEARKNALDAKKAEADYKKNVAKQGSEISDLQSQIDILSLDTSEEARAKRLELEKQLADKKSALEDDQNQHNIDSQKDALDKEAERYQQFIDKKIKDIDNYIDKVDKQNEKEIADYEKNMEKRIKDIDDYLARSGEVMQDAIDLITNHGQETFDKLIKWNADYGTGINEDIVQAWQAGAEAARKYQELIFQLNNVKPVPVPDYFSMFKSASNAIYIATQQLKKYNEQLKAMSDINYIPRPIDENNPPLIPRHTGVETGFVKGLKSNEEFAKLMAGELVINPEQMNNFMRKTLPNMTGMVSAESKNNNGFSIEKLLNITVNGNLDKTVLPDLEKLANTVVEKINKSMLNRGYVRLSSSTGI